MFTIYIGGINDEFRYNNDNLKLKVISDVLNTYSTTTIEKEIQATERTFIREKSRIESERIKAIKEMYINTVNKSYEEKREITRILGELLLNNKCNHEILSACSILVSVRGMNSLESRNNNLKLFESAPSQYILE